MLCSHYAYLPALVFIHAGQFHSFCWTLLAFAGQYCTTVLVGKRRLILSQIFYKLKTQILFPLHCGYHLLAHSLGNGLKLVTHWHPSCGWHSSWTASILSRSNFSGLILSICTCLVKNFRENFESFRDSRMQGQFPGRLASRLWRTISQNLVRLDFVL